MPGSSTDPQACGPHSSNAYGTACGRAPAGATIAIATRLIQRATTPCQRGEPDRDLEDPAVEPQVAAGARDADVLRGVGPRAGVGGLQTDLQPGRARPGPDLPAHVPETDV